MRTDSASREVSEETIDMLPAHDCQIGYFSSAHSLHARSLPPAVRAPNQIVGLDRFWGSEVTRSQGALLPGRISALGFCWRNEFICARLHWDLMKLSGGGGGEGEEDRKYLYIFKPCLKLDDHDALY